MVSVLLIGFLLGRTTAVVMVEKFQPVGDRTFPDWVLDGVYVAAIVLV